jgi:hypothetical protein
VGTFLAFAALVAFGVGVVALIKGRLPKLGIAGRKQALLVLVGSFVVFIVGVSISEPTEPSSTSASPSPEVSSSPSVAPSAEPSSLAPSTAAPVVKLTAPQKEQVKSILLNSVSHYETQLARGADILPETPYPNAGAALAAYSNPSSPASRWREFGQANGPFKDFSYMEAEKQARAVYPDVASMPDALSDWSSEMNEMSSAWADWFFVANDWQTSSASDSELQAAEKDVRDALARARSTVGAVIANS